MRLESVRYGRNHLDAIIVVLDALTVDAQRTFLASGRPVVTISTFHPELGIPAVCPEAGNGIAAMIRHLVQHGHQRIGFSGCLSYPDMVGRYEAYQAALRAEGIVPDPRLFFAAPGAMEEDGRSVGDAMLAAGVPCTALCAASDRIALGIMERLQHAGCRVPTDVALTGFDGAKAGDFSIPALTTVKVNLHEVGGTAARLVMAQLAGQHIPAEVVSVATYPVYRQSCGCSSVGTMAPVVPQEAAAPDAWVDTLRKSMLAAVMPGGFATLSDDAARLSTRVGQICDALAAVLDNQPCPSPGALTEAWRDLCDGAVSIDAVSYAFDCLHEAALARRSYAVTTAHEHVHAFISQMRTELLYGARYSSATREFDADTHILRSFRANLRLLEPGAESASDLNWLAETPASAGCVGLWRDGVPGSELVIAGLYGSEEQTEGARGGSLLPQAFPPLDVLAPAMAANPLHMLLVLPLRTADRDWGAFAVLLNPEEIVSAKAEVGVWQWTSLLMAALERERLMQVAETLADMRSELVATVSHEVRTPLTAIIGNAELLKARWESVSREKAMQQLDAIIQSAARQAELAESLLLLNRLEGGGMESTLQPVSLTGAIEHACDEVRVSYPGQEIRLDGPPDVRVLADGNKLIQILRNLVDNAAKYSPVDSSVDIAWSVASMGVVIDVRDHGSGVPDIGRSRLFTRFGRIAGSRARPGHSSTGLGLYLSRGLAESMRGRLDLVANGPDGATFRLCLQPSM